MLQKKNLTGCWLSKLRKTVLDATRAKMADIIEENRGLREVCARRWAPLVVGRPL
jgi:hypothetical protein